MVKENYKQQFTLDYFEKDEKALKHLTGLSFGIMLAIFNLISSFINFHESSISKFDKFILTLMKLRLNSSQCDLALRFKINQSNVSRNISHFVNLLYKTLKPIALFWPNRDDLRKQRKSFGKRFSAGHLKSFITMHICHLCSEVI